MEPTGNTTSMLTEPSTPLRPVSDASHSPSSTKAPSSGITNSSPRSSRKRTNDQVYAVSPTKTIKSSSRPSTAPDQPRTTFLGQPLDFDHYKLFTESSDLNMTTVVDGEKSEPGAELRSSEGDLHQAPKFMEEIEQYKRELEHEYDAFEKSLQSESRSDLPEMEWEELESRYDGTVRPLARVEQELLQAFSERFQHFLLWMQVSNSREADRAIKRLRTRVAFVKNSEEKLAEKQAHYDKVLNAFQNAMALLGNI